MGKLEDKLYYFAHPYIVKDKNKNNIHAAEKANYNLCCVRFAKLFKKGYMVYAPISHTHPIHTRDPKFLQDNEYNLWIKFDDLFIEKCNFDGIILAPDWENSSGCLYEKKKFEEKGLEILFYKEIIGGDL